MLNSLIKNLLILSCTLGVFNLNAQVYSWKVDVKVNPVNVFFDQTPIYDAGFRTGFKLRSMNFFNDRFKESKAIAISKSFGKSSIQFCYATYGNTYFPNLEKVGDRFTFVRSFRDFNVNYFRYYATTNNEMFAFSWGAGLRYRHGREMRIYGAGGQEPPTNNYQLRDLGVNVIHQIDYNVLDRFKLFTQCNIFSTVYRGHSASKELFDNSTLDPNYRPQRFNFSLGFGVSYNFNL